MMIRHILKWNPANVNTGYVKKIYISDSKLVFIMNDYFRNKLLNNIARTDVYISCEDEDGNTLFRSSSTHVDDQNNIEIFVPIEKINVDKNLPLWIHVGNNKYKLSINKHLELPMIYNQKTKYFYRLIISKNNNLGIERINNEEYISIDSLSIYNKNINITLSLVLPSHFTEIIKNPKNFSLIIEAISDETSHRITEINFDNIHNYYSCTIQLSTQLPVQKIDTIHKLTFSLNKKDSKSYFNNLPIQIKSNALFNNELIVIDNDSYFLNTVLDENNNDTSQYIIKVEKLKFEPRVKLVEKVSLNSFKITIEFYGKYSHAILNQVKTDPLLLFVERSNKATMLYKAKINRFTQNTEVVEAIIDETSVLKNSTFSTGIWDAFLKLGDKIFPVANPRKNLIQYYRAYNYPQIVIKNQLDQYSLKLYYNFKGYLSLLIRDYVIFKNLKSISFINRKLHINGNVNIMKPNKGLSGSYSGEISIPVPFEKPVVLPINIQLQKTDKNDIEYKFLIKSLVKINKKISKKIITAKTYSNWIVQSTDEQFKFRFPIISEKEVNIGISQLIKTNRFISKSKKLLDKFKIPTYKLFTKILPVKKNTFVFQSFYGNSYADNPKAIYEKLYELEGDKNKYVWVLKDSNLFTGKKAKIVKPFSWKYYYYMARAQFFINNANFPDFFIKRKNTFFLQTWHGTPLKKLGLDVPKDASAYAANSDIKLLERTKKWDILISPNEYTSEIMKRAYQLNIPIKTIGYPRNDQLVNVDKEKIEKVKEYFNIPKDKKVILYAPTWREDDDKKESYRLKFNVNKFYKTLKNKYVILLRLHYFDAKRMQLKDYSDFIINATYYNDIGDLYNIADILITDYSSVMFDFSITKKPMIFYAYDYAKYQDKLRGFYLDFKAIAPGPIVKDSDELLFTIKNIEKINEKYKTKYEKFRNQFCSHESGNASLETINILNRFRKGEKIE